LRVLLITYSLRTLNVDYTLLQEAIKRNSTSWWHFLDSTWIVETPLTADDLARILISHIYPADSILVARITPEQQGWLPLSAWEWLNKRNY